MRSMVVGALLHRPHRHGAMRRATSPVSQGRKVKSAQIWSLGGL